MTKIVIIGSGIAGYSVATEIRKHNQDKEIIMITADNGDYYYKPSISTALTNDKDANSLVMFPASAMQTRLNLNMMTEKVADGSEIQNGIVIVDGEKVPFESCVIACGSEPYSLNVSTSGAGDIIAVNNLDDYRLFRQRLSKDSKVAIIGAGLVGSEFAADMSSSNYDVTVFGDQAYPLNNLIPTELAEVFIDCMEKNGVKWVLSDLVNEVSKEKNKYTIKTTKGDIYQDFDIVFYAIGIGPNTTFAKQAGIKINKGICINSRCETNFKNVYAIGDCAEFGQQLLPYIAPIKKCAQALGLTLTGSPTDFSYPPMPIVVKTPPCPILSCLPPNASSLRINVEGEGNSFIIRYFDSDESVKGFVLSGGAVKNRMALLQEMS